MQYLSDIDYLSRLSTRSSFTMLNSSTDLKDYIMLSLYLIDSKMYLVTSCLAAGTTNFRIAISSPEAASNSPKSWDVFLNILAWVHSGISH